MFTVRGHLDGTVYTVTVGDADDGGVSGSPRIRGLLATHVGEALSVTPTGPTVVLGMDHPASILGALYALTTVMEVEGDAPEVIPPHVHGAVY